MPVAKEIDKKDKGSLKIKELPKELQDRQIFQTEYPKSVTRNYFQQRKDVVAYKDTLGRTYRLSEVPGEFDVTLPKGRDLPKYPRVGETLSLTSKDGDTLRLTVTSTIFFDGRKSGLVKGKIS